MGKATEGRGFQNSLKLKQFVHVSYAGQKDFHLLEEQGNLV